MERCGPFLQLGDALPHACQPLDASLSWKQHKAELSRLFPQFTDLLVAVVQGDTPEEAEATATALAERIAADTTHFRGVSRPDASPYLERNGLLFLVAWLRRPTVAGFVALAALGVVLPPRLKGAARPSESWRRPTPSSARSGGRRPTPC